MLGPPASGKGTQGRRLAESLGLAYLSTGALLREEMERGTDLGEKARPILACGGYLPDELMFPILSEWLEGRDGGWVLDGFPRSLPQARFLDEWLKGRGLKLDGAIALDVPLDELVSRIRNRVECPDCRWTGQRYQLKEGRCPVCGGPARGRADDSEANFRSRYAEYGMHTVPVIAYYTKTGCLRTIDATAPQEMVAAKILETLDTAASGRSNSSF
jgi:adenylate kinase